MIRLGLLLETLRTVATPLPTHVRQELNIAIHPYTFRTTECDIRANLAHDVKYIELIADYRSDCDKTLEWYVRSINER